MKGAVVGAVRDQCDGNGEPPDPTVDRSIMPEPVGSEVCHTLRRERLQRL